MISKEDREAMEQELANLRYIQEQAKQQLEEVKKGWGPVRTLSQTVQQLAAPNNFIARFDRVFKGA